MKKNIIVNTISRINKIIPNSFKKKSLVLTLMIWFNSLFEIVGLASILPLLAAILKDGFIHDQAILKSVFNTFGFQNNNHFILALCLAIFSFILVKNIFGVWVQKKQASFSWSLHETLSSKVLENAYKRGFLFFTQNNSNKILNRVNTVPQQFAQQMLVNVFQLINELIILTLIIISLLAYDYLILLLLAGIILPVFLSFYHLTKKRISYYGSQLNILAPQIVKPVYEVIFGYVDVVVNGIFNSYKKNYLSKINEAKSLRVKMAIIQNIPNRLIESCVILAVLIMLLYGLLVLKDTSQIITLMSIFGLAAYRTIPSINRLMLAIVNIKNFQYTLDYLEDFLSPTKEISESDKLEFNNKLSVEGISFSYPDSEEVVLKNINLEITKGESIGIMGTSGSGKTTLMNIMLGFLNPTEGRLTLDDQAIDDDNRDTWQQMCGYVRQDVFLIDGSLEENIAFGIPKDKIDTQRLKMAIDQAQLTSLLKNFPEGSATNIGERGAKISGGQRQRVGIARALYHGAKFLFFDEATSALDSATEEEITESIKSLHESHLTIVIIAHREDTLKYCDRIFKL